MNQSPITYVISPRGKARVVVGIFALGIPTVLVCTYLYPADPSSSEWHVSGTTKVFTQFLILAILGGMFAAGLYLTLFVRTVVLDVQRGSVIRLTRFLGKIVHRRVWSLSEFTRVELNHRCAGSDTDTFQSDVGMRHRSGVVVWLRAFLIESKRPFPEALTFVQELSEATGLRYDE